MVKAKVTLLSPALSSVAVAVAVATTVAGATIAVAAPGGGRGAGAAPGAPAASGWLGEELPLPLAVRTPQDLAIKAAAERQYLIFNLVAGGKLAFDGGDYATAAAKWEALLRLPGLDVEVERAIRPLATEARSRAGGHAPALPPPPVELPGPVPSPAGSTEGVRESGATGRPAPPRRAPGAGGVVVSGTVTGGGALGPGGTVLWLKRSTGETPHPAPARGKVITQRGKTFIPRVLAVPVGTKVDFRNEDDIFHNVFSLSRPNDFDTGLYRQGGSYAETFHRAGVVQLLCNIHSSMLGYVYVVDSPWYAQADAAGAFTIKNVPPGDYEIEGWHEASSRPFKQRLTVSADGARGVVVRISGDKHAPQFVPDKSGKPRQSHLTY